MVLQLRQFLQHKVPPEQSAAFVAPRTPVEQQVADVWAEVLGIDRVGSHDNFFEAGGHSLLAMQVMSRLRKTFGVEIPLRRLFEQPTIAGLAETLVQHEAVPGQISAIARLRKKLDQMSEDEVVAILREKSAT